MQIEEEVTEFVCSGSRSADGRASSSAWAIYERLKISCTSLCERGPDWGQWQTRRLERGQRAKVVSMRHQSDRPMMASAKVISTALLLIGCASTASAQGYWYYGDYGLKQRGYYGTPYGGGPQYGSGGGDQYGYGPA